MKNTKLKRLLSIVMVLAMVMSFMVVPVTAVTTEGEECKCTEKCGETPLAECAVCAAGGECKGEVKQAAEECKCTEKCGETPLAECAVCAAGGECKGEVKQAAEECKCTEKCGETPLAECAVCVAGGECKGEVKENAPATCACEGGNKCTEGAANVNCTVCSAEGADLTACKGTAPEVTPVADGDTTPTGTLSTNQINMNDESDVHITAEISNLSATKSIVVKLLSGSEVIATTTLQKTEYLSLPTLGVKISITGTDDSWATVWAAGMPRADVVPTAMELWVDDTKVSEANFVLVKTNGEASINWADVPGVNDAPASALIENALQAYDNADRENVTTGLYNVNAKSELKVELWSGNTLLSTTTMRQTDRDDPNASLFPVKGSCTVNIVLSGRLAGSWDTTWHVAPTTENLPDTIKVYVDGGTTPTNTLTMEGGCFYSTDGDHKATYLGMDALKVAVAFIDTDKDGVLDEGESKFTSLGAAITAAADGDTVTLLEDVTAAAAINETGITLDLGGKTLTLADGANNYFFGTSTIQNGTISIDGVEVGGDCIIGIGNYSNDAVLNLNNVNVIGNGYSSAYAVFYVYGNSTLNITGGETTLSNDAFDAGGYIKAEEGVNGKVNLSNTKISLTDAKIGFLDGTVTMTNVDLDITGGANAINGSALTVNDSTLTIKDCVGRALTLNQGNVTINNSTLDFSGATEGEIRFKSDKTLEFTGDSNLNKCTIYSDEGKTGTVKGLDSEGASLSAEIKGTVTEPDTIKVVEDVITITDGSVAKNVTTGETYKTIQAAVDAAQAGDTIEVFEDVTNEAVTVDKSVTITGDKTLNNVSITANGTDVALTVSGLKFTGNSWINSGNANKLTVSGVTANVAPNNGSATNSRPGFIALGASEGNALALVVEGSTFVVTGGGDPIIGWAQITSATISGNTFGSADSYIENADAAKFMSIANGATFTISGNTVYSNYNGFVFSQNTTRDNAYTVVVDGNSFNGSADHIWVEVSGATTTNATVKATSTNTVNGNAFTAADIKDSVATWTSYAGVDVMTDEDGKLIGGTFTAKTSKNLIADGYKAVDNTDGTWTVAQIEYVAEVNGTKYDTIQKAVDAAKAGDTVTIIADVSSEAVTVDKSITLDLNGHTLTNEPGKHTITNTNNASLTIKNGTVDNVSGGSVGAAVFNDVGSTVTIESATITRSTGGTDWTNGYYVIENHGTMTINGSTVSSAGNYAALIENGWYDESQNTTGAPSTMTINGGTFTGGNYNVKNDGYGVLTINNGTFTSTGTSNVLNWNTATINGGSFSSDNYGVFQGNDDSAAYGEGVYDGVLNITGGNFTVGAVIGEAATPIGPTAITGGTYDKDPTTWVGTGYCAKDNGNGTWTVGESDVKKVEAANATCTTGAITEHYECGHCGKLFSDADHKNEVEKSDVITAAPGHTKVHHKASSATCTKDGNLEYWYCTVCKKYFEDEACTKETTLEAVTIKAGHTLGDYENDDKYHWQECEDCDYETKQEKHDYGKWVTTKKPTESTTGKRYRECKVCGYEQWQTLDKVTNANTGDVIMIAVGVMAVAGIALVVLLIVSKKRYKGKY